MTNGEKLKEVFPSIKLYEKSHDAIQINFDSVWWSAEYKDPTTKNDLALIHTEGLDEEIRCTMCTNHMKSDRGCDGSCVVNKDMYKAVMDAIEKRIQPTTKNDLANDVPDINVGKIDSTTKNDLVVDCIDRQATLDAIIKRLGIRNETYLLEAERVIYQQILAMPSVTPIRPKGHWINTANPRMSDNIVCSECGYNSIADYKFCPNCGADMRGNTKRKGEPIEGNNESYNCENWIP